MIVWPLVSFTAAKLAITAVMLGLEGSDLEALAPDCYTC